jgi:outer membrane beta-barrel protein
MGTELMKFDMKNRNIKQHILYVVALLLLVCDVMPAARLSAASFDKYEIRVIRPRYFAKRKKFELGVGGGVVTNQSFIYTYNGSLALTYHFTEQWGLEASGSFGFPVDKDDKRILNGENYGIKTQIIRTESSMDLTALYTPIYGKYQLSSGRLIYFDTYLAFGLGQAGVNYQYDNCPRQEDALPGVVVTDPSDPTVISYPEFVLGLGQRYFINKKDSLKWEVRNHRFSYDPNDGACPDDGASEGSRSHNNINMQVGFSRFF